MAWMSYSSVKAAIIYYRASIFVPYFEADGVLREV